MKLASLVVAKSELSSANCMAQLRTSNKEMDWNWMGNFICSLLEGIKQLVIHVTGFPFEKCVGHCSMADKLSACGTNGPRVKTL